MERSDAEIQYSNPIVPGFAPDPSVVFAEGTFFLCTSSFHVFPGLPIYASKDLKSWTHIGNALHKRSQLSLRNANTIHVPLDTGFTMVATTGIVAPSIHYHEGVFYIVTTNQTFNGEDYERHNFIIKCHDIWSNDWSDPVYFDYHGIDTSLFFHDDGRVFVQGAWHIRDDRQPTNTIKQNPIMTADGTDEYIQNIGHGSLFQDGDGRWWAAVLGVRKQPNGTLGLGRESFLSPVDWPEGGWPTVRQPRMGFKREAVQSLNPSKPLQAPSHIEDLYIRDHDEENYQYLDDEETLQLIPSRYGLDSAIESPTFLGRRQRFLTGTGSTRLTADQGLTGKSIRAGISLYKDPLRFASLAYDFDNTTAVFEVHNSATGLFGTVSHKLSLGLVEVQLQVVAMSSRYSFQVKETLQETKVDMDKGWIEIGSVETKALDARDFTGPLISVFAQTLLKEAKREPVIFHEFKLQALE
ncbi:xylosidase/arabinosidase [Fusarium oxysporum Fo47]|uniref:xylosidase/arabinosidase n=1 Tax=Fusarium oxysporum Fo47 TaxID=660027 RepID=UPI0028699413|nr:xylosidase/arabinosidase [Fusarium oxysporum Fo47]QKD58971.2 xylosidase/arabinosidase [Fusarium oxysporum Fo47]